jgi:hypothetical protein
MKSGIILNMIGIKQSNKRMNQTGTNTHSRSGHSHIGQSEKKTWIHHALALARRATEGLLSSLKALNPVEQTFLKKLF